MTEITPEYLAYRNKFMKRFWAAIEPMLHEAWQEAHGQGPDPEPPPQSDYDGGRIQVVWNTGTVPDRVLEGYPKITQWRHVYAMVVTADIYHISDIVSGTLKHMRQEGIKVYAYVRAPVHMRVNERWTLDNVSAAVPFEHAVGELVKRRNAYAFDAAGKPIFHSSGYDVYLNPTLIAEEHAALVMEHAWDPEFYDGILADGLVTNQPYAWAANFTVDEQRAALIDWADAIDAPIIGNGSWEPRGDDYIYSWADIIQGAMDEDMTHPHYNADNPSIQTPPLSERWAHHMERAKEWKGKEYWIGDNLRLFPELPEEQRRRFLITSALMVDAKVVMTDHPWLRLNLGKPVEAYERPDGLWRGFEGGTVGCFYPRMDGEIEY